MKFIFSQRLRELRKAHGLSLAQLGEKIGLAKQTLSHFELGKAYPSYPVLEKMADLFECPVDYLMGRENVSFEAPPSHPKWLAELIPELESLNQAGQESVKALVRGLKK
jgi:transcriptional regulator with XRE-family HTH domain